MEEPTIQTRKIKLSFFILLIFILTYIVLFIGMNLIFNGINSGLILFGIPLLGAIFASFLVKLSSKVKLKNDAQNITFKNNPILSIFLWAILAVILGFLLYFTLPIIFLFISFLGH